jgi:hypothetical protein
MTLSPIEAEAFLRIWSTVDAYVCQHTGVLPGIGRPEQMRHRPVEDLAKVRKALWSNPHLLDDFVRDNPFSLSPPELEDVRRFRHSVRGRFFVERHLKDYAVFVSTTGDQKVLAVRGITDPPQEVLGRIQPLGLAAMVEAVLLPFRGRIVWDGLVRVLPISFGPGIRQGFRDAYLSAKERSEIIVSLDDGPRKLQPRAKARDWRPAVGEIIRATAALGRTDTGLQAAAFRLLKQSAHLAQAALQNPANLDNIVAVARKTRRALDQLSDAARRTQ